MDLFFLNRGHHYCRQEVAGQAGVCARRLRLGAQCQASFQCVDSLCLYPQIKDGQTKKRYTMYLVPQRTMYYCLPNQYWYR